MVMAVCKYCELEVKETDGSVHDQLIRCSCDPDAIQSSAPRRARRMSQSLLRLEELLPIHVKRKQYVEDVVGTLSRAS